MNEVTAAVRPTRNAILVHATDGKVCHTFLPEREAHAQFDEIHRNRAGGSVLVLDLDWDAEDYLKLSPNFRNRLEKARSRLERSIKWNEIMDRHGVPSDLDARAKVLKAAEEIVSTTLGEALSRL
jgi:hypothetical protein